jgi:hypothetical protein
MSHRLFHADSRSLPVGRYSILALLILSLALSTRVNPFFIFMIPLVFGLNVLLQFLMKAVALRMFPNPICHGVAQLLPSVVFACWFVSTQSIWCLPEILFREHVTRTIPESVTELRGYEAKMEVSWRGNLSFHLNPSDFDVILNSHPFERIPSSSLRFREVLSDARFFWKRPGWPDPDQMADPELYVCNITPDTRIYMLADGARSVVLFQKYRGPRYRKYL